MQTCQSEMPIRDADTADAGAIASVHIQAWQETFAGILPAEYLAGFSLRRRTAAWADALEAGRPAEINLVVEADGDEIVGFAAGGPERDGDSTYSGELYAICVLRPYQRRGFGRGLISAAADRLLLHGFRSMLVWVLQDNRAACSFVEALGGERVNRKIIKIGGVDLVEVAFGWKDATALIATQRA